MLVQKPLVELTQPHFTWACQALPRSTPPSEPASLWSSRCQAGERLLECKDKTIRLSLNTGLIDKESVGGDEAYRSGFIPQQITIEELRDAVFEGIAFSYQYQGGIRNTANFIATEFLAADYDGAVSIDEALASDVVKEHGTLLYTTPSHTAEEHHFRVVFALPRTISDPVELRAAARALTQRLGSDMTATDPARIFFGSKGCDAQLLGRCISPEFLDGLIDDGRLSWSSSSATRNVATGNRSLSRIEPELEVRLANGTVMPFKDIEGKQSVHCPFHPDVRASAFVSQGKHDNFLHCSTYQKTWWPAESSAHSHDFFDFDRIVKAIKAHGFKKAGDDLVGLERFMGPQVVRPNNISILEDRHLDPSRVSIDTSQSGLTLVKSPKGSGKTTLLAKLLETPVETANSLFPEDGDCSSARPHIKDNVLLIGHRQALIGGLCQRLGLNSYLDHPERRGSHKLALAKRRFGVCLDSLRRVEDTKYDVIIIDEVEQVLAHFLSDTIGSARFRVFDAFCRLLCEARHVIALDADLGWATFSTLRMMLSRNDDLTDTDCSSELERPINIVLNEWRDTERSLALYDSKEHLVERLKQAILSGQRVFVTSNTKTQIDALTKVVEQLPTRVGKRSPTSQSHPTTRGRRLHRTSSRASARRRSSIGSYFHLRRWAPGSTSHSPTGARRLTRCSDCSSPGSRVTSRSTSSWLESETRKKFTSG